MGLAYQIKFTMNNLTCETSIDIIVDLTCAIDKDWLTSILYYTFVEARKFISIHDILFNEIVSINETQ